MWAREDLERIKDLVCYRLVIHCLPALNLYLAYAFTEADSVHLRQAKELAIRLKSQVRYCIFIPQSFQTIEVPRKQDWQSWSDSPGRYLNFIHFAKLAYRIFGMDWFTNAPDANAGNGGRPWRDSRDNSQAHLTALTSLNTAANTQPSDTIAPPQSLSPSKYSGDSTDPNVMRKDLSDAVTGVDSGGSGTGAPDENPNHFSYATGVSSGSTTTGSDNSTFDLGQKIQSLLQQQLIQDQKEKEMLQKRVSQLEERCKVAEQKAEDEQKRMEKIALEVEQTQHIWATDQSLLQQQLEYYQRENQNLKERTKESDSQMTQLVGKHKEEAKRRDLKIIRLEEEVEKAKKTRDIEIRITDEQIKNQKEYYKSQLSGARQQIRTHTDELRRSRERILQIREITDI